MQRFRRVAATILCFALVMTATPAPGASRVQALSFADASNGWLGGWFPTQKGFVSYTTDGGASWTATSTATFPISSIVAGPSGTNAWATAGESNKNVFRFTRAPFIWTEGNSVIPSGSGDYSYTNVIPARIIRLANGRLVAVGQIQGYSSREVEPPDSLPHGRVGFVATSDDAGVSWLKRWAGPLYKPLSATADPLPTWASVSDVAVSPDGTVLYAIGNEWNNTGTISTTYKRRFVLKSTDGGLTWGSQTAPTIVTGTTPLNAITVPSATVAYAFGNARTAIKTTNGSTWTAITTLPAFTALSSNPHIVAADSINTNTVVIAANRQRVKATDPYSAQLARTTDGGVTWTLSGAYDANLYAVKASSSGNLVAVGTNEHIIRSTDGGVNWSFPYGEAAPFVTRTQPTANFSYASGPVTISGTAHDTTGLTPGVGVRMVEVLIRKADGQSWNGVAWTSTETWLPATTSDGWKTWSRVWAADPTLLAAPSQVSVRARATDGIGLVSALSPAVTSSVPQPPQPELRATAISIENGESFTNTPNVAVSIDATGATTMWWRVDGGIPTSPTTKTDTAQVDLGAGEGTRTVTFSFDDANPGTTHPDAADDIVLDMTSPTVTLTQPASATGASIGSFAGVNIQAQAVDALSGVDPAGPGSAEYSIERSDGVWWTGEGWSGEPTWISLANGTGDGWSGIWYPDTDFLDSGRTAVLRVRATDRAGNVGHSSSATLTATAERRPNVAITSPKAGYYITSTALQTVRGTISDALSRVTAVDISIRRSDGRWWSGGSWVTTQRWIAVPVTEGATSWSTTWRPDSAFVASGRSVTIFARAKDAYGNERVSASVSSKARVKASLTRPSMATYTLVRGRGYRATGTLKPRHTAGTYPVRVQAYRLVNGKYRYWGSFRAKATDVTGGSRYTATVKLPYKGKWRLRAYHSDTPHLPTYSTWRYVTVR